MIFCYFCFGDTFSAIDAFVKLILVITGSALIICFCHRLTNYKKSRRYKSGAGGLHHSANHHHHQLQEPPLSARYYGLPADQLAYDPYNNNTNNRHLAGFSYGNLLGTPPIAQQINYPLGDNNTNNSINQYAAYLRGPGSALLRHSGGASIMPPHLIANPVYSQHQQQLPSGIDAGESHPSLSEDQQQQQQSSDCLADGVILDACPSYEEAIGANNSGCDAAANADVDSNADAGDDVKEEEEEEEEQQEQELEDA